MGIMRTCSVLALLVAATPARANKCERIADPGRLELQLDPRRPERVVDIFWSDPNAIAHEYRWDVIAQALVWGTYSCDDEVDVKDVHRFLTAAGDECATDRTAVIRQLVRGAIKQGVEATWSPTRKLWRCEQRLARRAAKRAPRSKPLSTRDQCLADGNPPQVCDAGGLFGPR